MNENEAGQEEDDEEDEEEEGDDEEEDEDGENAEGAGGFRNQEFKKRGRALGYYKGLLTKL